MIFVLAVMFGLADRTSAQGIDVREDWVKNLTVIVNLKHLTRSTLTSCNLQVICTQRLGSFNAKLF